MPPAILVVAVMAFFLGGNTVPTCMGLVVLQTPSQFVNFLISKCAY